MTAEQFEDAREAMEACRDQVENADNAVVDPDPIDNSPVVDDVVQSQQYSGEVAFEEDPQPPVEEEAIQTAPAPEPTDVPTQPEEAPAAEAKPRRKPVKGVVAKARELLANGEEDSAILGYLQVMYLEGGRDEKNAKESAQVVLHDVKHRALKAK